MTMCDPVNTIAKMQVELEAKEPLWIEQLKAAIARRSRILERLEFKNSTATAPP